MVGPCAPEWGAPGCEIEAQALDPGVASLNRAWAPVVARSQPGWRRQQDPNTRAMTMAGSMCVPHIPAISSPLGHGAPRAHG